MVDGVLEDVWHGHVVRPIVAERAVEVRDFLAFAVRRPPVPLLLCGDAPLNVLAASLGVLLQRDPLALLLGIDHPSVLHGLALVLQIALVEVVFLDSVHALVVHYHFGFSFLSRTALCYAVLRQAYRVWYAGMLLCDFPLPRYTKRKFTCGEPCVNADV